MSDTTDPEPCFLINNVCKSPQNFEFSKAEQPFTFVRFEKFPGFVILREGIEPIASLVFYLVIKKWESLKKAIYIKNGKQQ